MTIPDAEQRHIVRLAKEGKQISKIQEEDFPQYDYWDVHWVAVDGGQPSATGVKAKITRRLNDLSQANKARRTELVEEIANLVSHLYWNHKSNASKLNKIRKALDG